MITDVKKRKIYQLRKKGLGYKLIAQKLRLSRDQVRDYMRTRTARADLKKFRFTKVRLPRVYKKES